MCAALSLTKEKRNHGGKKATCVSSHSARVLPLSKTAPLPLSPLLFSISHSPVVAVDAEWEMFGCHGNAFPKWNKFLAAYIVK